MNNTIQKIPKHKQTKHDRLPNKGSVTFKKGKRRRPYWVNITVGYNPNGSPVKATIGWAADFWEGVRMLEKYNSDPYDLSEKIPKDAVINKTTILYDQILETLREKENISAEEKAKQQKQNLTFAEVYQKWYAEKFENPKRKYSYSYLYTTRSGFNNCSDIHDRLIISITAEDMQNVLDACNLKHSSLEHILTVFKGVFEYAMKYDIVTKDYSKFVQIRRPDDDESGEPFSKEELSRIWAKKNDPEVSNILIMIYSGWRVSEFLSLNRETVDLENGIMTGGVKTKSGKNRIVPIHPAIRTFVEGKLESSHWIAPNKSNSNAIDRTNYRTVFAEAIKRCGINRKCTPHDCRHTFVTIATECKVDPLAIKLIAGHAITDFTERKYTHMSPEWLREEIRKIKIDV